MRFITSIVLLSTLTSLVFAASALVDNLPTDLAGRMRSGGAAGLVLDLPADFPSFEYPAEVAVLGSVEEAFTYNVVLGELAADGHTRLTEMLLDAGWKYLPNPITSRNTGFIGALRPERPAMYCHDSEIGRLSLDRVSNQGERYLLLGLQTRSAFRPGPGDALNCQEEIERNQQSTQSRGPVLGSYMPRLELPGLGNPATVPEMHSGSNGGGQNDQLTSAFITTPFTSAEISEHLGEQLSAQGWTPVGDINAPYQLTSAWTSQLNDGSLLLGVLGIVEIGENKFDMYFRLVRRTASN